MDERKTKIISVVVTDKERAAIKKAAKALDITVSSFIRKTILKELKK